MSNEVIEGQDQGGQGQQQENQGGQGQQTEGEAASETTEMSAGAKALDECKKAYADMTATEVELGFGDCHCDWRAPLAQVDIFNKAEAQAAEDSETTIYTYVEYGATGEKLTGEGAKDRAEEFHAATDKKKELLKEYYPEVFAERYPDEVETEDSGEGEEASDDDQD